LLVALYLLDFLDWTYVNDDPLAEVMVMRYRMEVVLPGVLKTTKYFVLFFTNFYLYISLAYINKQSEIK
jgi:hypothetical protein